MTEAVTSVNDIDKHKRIEEVTKYPDEPPGFGTSSREAKGKPKQNERCDPATENVGDCRLI